MNIIGKKLETLEYMESQNKPNLFYKKINEKVIFADLRGTEVIPIWDDWRPMIYSKDLSNKDFYIEYINLTREGCNPRVSFYDESEPEGRLFGISNEIPSGYCKQCGADILYKAPWELLFVDFDAGLHNYEKEGIDAEIEIFTCDTCRNNRKREEFIIKLK